MAPGQPGQPRAVRAQPGGSVEVVARHEHAAAGRIAPGGLAADLQADDGVDGFVTWDNMVLADAHQAVAAAIQHEIGIAQRQLRRDGLRFLAVTHRVYALVREIDEEHLAAIDQVLAAAVFMHARADIEWRRGDIRARAIGPLPHEHRPAALCRAALKPVHIVRIQRDPPQPHAAGDDQVGRDGRPPTAIGCNPRLSHVMFSLLRLITAQFRVRAVARDPGTRGSRRGGCPGRRPPASAARRPPRGPRARRPARRRRGTRPG